VAWFRCNKKPQQASASGCKDIYELQRVVGQQDIPVDAASPYLCTQHTAAHMVTYCELLYHLPACIPTCSRDDPVMYPASQQELLVQNSNVRDKDMGHTIAESHTSLTKTV
jgi:hypothetical protein